MKTTATARPTKPGPQRDREIEIPHIKKDKKFIDAI